MSQQTGVMPGGRPARPLPTKYLMFAAIVAMAAYVLYHNERFLIDWSAPVWNHYDPFKWWLLPHGLAGACALFLAPMQFAERLRRRHTALHRTVGTMYVVACFVLAPAGLYIQYLDEAQGAARSFTIETMIQSSALMITTGLGCYFALKRQFTFHRQWMIRSYAVALTFLEIRVILGVFGLDQPFDWHITETVVWGCVASSLLIGTSPISFMKAIWRGGEPQPPGATWKSGNLSPSLADNGPAPCANAPHVSLRGAQRRSNPHHMRIASPRISRGSQ